MPVTVKKFRANSHPTEVLCNRLEIYSKIQLLCSSELFESTRLIGKFDLQNLYDSCLSANYLQLNSLSKRHPPGFPYTDASDYLL